MRFPANGSPPRHGLFDGYRCQSLSSSFVLVIPGPILPGSAADPLGQKLNVPETECPALWINLPVSISILATANSAREDPLF